MHAHLSNRARKRPGRGLRAVLAGAVVFGALGATAASASADSLYVSVHGKNSNPCSAEEPCRTIEHTLAKARPNDFVKVSGGIYREEAKVTKRIRLVALANATIDARGLANGILIEGAGAKGAEAIGFTVEHANFEGILAKRTTDVYIASNKVRDNDLGARAQHPVGECAAVGEVPGDCGEGIHLMSVTRSEVFHNDVTANTGGILLTDELGPTAHNKIWRNDVLDNLYDCGITLAGHNTKAVSSTGQSQVFDGGVYGNTIRNNRSIGNGTRGEGAGVLIAAAAPGAGAYDNLVENNTLRDNSLAGVTVHSHTQQQDVNDNRIIGNTVGKNGAKGDAEYGESGTVGILVGSSVSRLARILIRGNKISDVHYGIYTKNAPAIDPHANTFFSVTVPIKQI